MSAENNSDDDFVRLFLMNQPRLYACIISLVPHVADADELFQECSIVLWSKRDEFQPDTNFLAWACQIALNKAFNLRMRQARSRVVYDDEFLQAVCDHRTATADRSDVRSAALKGCIEKLKARDRELLEVWYQECGTTKSLAEQLGRPLDTVYKAMRRIRSALFDCVSQAMREGGAV
jgi:RNA polymerase sigma-70 factor, ECF subfamily